MADKSPFSIETAFKDPEYEWNKLADTEFGSIDNMPLKRYLDEAESLKKHLEAHHMIEESFLFPILARRMPSFAQGDEHTNSHKAIHEGLERLASLTHEFKEHPQEYEPTRMRKCLDSFRDVLMSHLDAEVNDLRADNLKKYWKLEEIASIKF